MIVTKGISEPYRILTSREYRLLLRQDNTDSLEIGRKVGLVSDLVIREGGTAGKGARWLMDTRLHQQLSYGYLEKRTHKDGMSLEELLKREIVVDLQKLSGIRGMYYLKLPKNWRFK